MGVDKRRFLLKIHSFLFPYAVFMIMGFRAFFFLYFIKFRIYPHNSPRSFLHHCTAEDEGEGSHEPGGWSTVPPAELWSRPRPSDSPGVTQKSEANLSQFFPNFPVCEILVCCVEKKTLKEQACAYVLDRAGEQESWKAEEKGGLGDHEVVVYL